jgi:hypothetical protein
VPPPVGRFSDGLHFGDLPDDAFDCLDGIVKPCRPSVFGRIPDRTDGHLIEGAADRPCWPRARRMTGGTADRTMVMSDRSAGRRGGLREGSECIDHHRDRGPRGPARLPGCLASPGVTDLAKSRTSIVTTIRMINVITETTMATQNDSL